MSSRTISRLAWSCAVAAIAVPVLAYGQTAENSQPQTAPAAAPAAGWTTQTTTPAPDAEPGQQQPLDGAAPPIVLNPEQIDLIRRINEYLNNLETLEGRFVQTDHRNEKKRGRFYVQRPGRLRFDYAAPSKLRIVADGAYLAVEDHDLKTVDKFPLDATPIPLFLGKDVDLLRETVILDMRQDDQAVVVILADKSGTAGGELQLYFRLPELELYEWVITDAQGLDTRIQLADLVAGEEKPEDFFKSSAIELEKLGNN